MSKYIAWLASVGIKDINIVGGKNASLGEMIGALSKRGVRVPGGFATTVKAFQDFLSHNNLKTKIDNILTELDINHINELNAAGKQIRHWVLEGEFPQELQDDIIQAYQQLKSELGDRVSFAVRSSATAEDLPEASFAGQQETYLNVGSIDEVFDSIKKVFASLYNDRAISYRVHQQFDHEAVSLSAGVQQMVRSDIAASGVMFTLDTESGFKEVVFITSAYGLGETIVQGEVNPDEFYVYKPALEQGKHAILSRNCGSKKIKMVYADKQAQDNVLIEPVPEKQQKTFSLSDEQVQELAHYAVLIEQHYGRPMDIEWALDGNNDQLYIVQARPETVKSQENNLAQIDRYQLKQTANILLEGRAIGQRIGAGRVNIIHDIADMDKVKEGDILVTDMTDPDWEPVMKRASAIVTNRGGRTCHAAIIARELGVPAIVGTGNATQILHTNDLVTVSCAQGDTGHVYQGLLDFEHHKTQVDNLPKIPLKIMLNVGNPSRAFDFSNIPNDGVGLARLEFIISNTIGIHPKALLEFEQQTKEIQLEITRRTSGYASPVDFYVEKLSEGIATIAAAFAPKRVIIRLSDFKSNEYANLYAGSLYEPKEENPMLGFRGAARYISEDFQPCFELECRAIRKVRLDMGLNNVEIMIPFVRTLNEASAVIDLLKANGLERGKDDLRIIMMCELPVNALLAEQFLHYFDGFSIGSNDMTQLTLGMDRDSSLVAHEFDERNLAVKTLLSMAIKACHAQGKYVGICGQGPSDYPDFAVWLLAQDISSISLNPDSVIDTWQQLGSASR